MRPCAEGLVRPAEGRRASLEDRRGPSWAGYEAWSSCASFFPKILRLPGAFGATGLAAAAGSAATSATATSSSLVSTAASSVAISATATGSSLAPIAAAAAATATTDRTSH